MLGADILLSCLEREGVDLVFGLPGGSVIPLYDRLKEFESIKHVLMRHEQGAIHAAEGYAIATGKVGVCFATSGPGAANMMTGIANAYLDSVPLVVFSGQVGRDYLGKDSFQEACITGMSQPITKANILLQDAEDMAQVVINAFHIARTGRPGPVLVDIPKDIFTQDVPLPDLNLEPSERYRRKLQPSFISPDTVRKAHRLLSEAKNPLMVIGGGMNSTPENTANIIKLAELLDMPVINTLMANGLMPEDHPLSLGMVGMHGTTAANYAVQHCDVLLALGMRFDDRVTGDTSRFATRAKVIHVDIDSAEIDKNVFAQMPIVGDAKEFVKTFLEVNDKQDFQHSEWRAEVDQERKTVRVHKGEHLAPEEIFPLINSLLDDNTIVVTDVGQHQMWSALYLHPHGERRFITSGGLGTMGYGFPAAIGAQMAKPEAKIILITGDGSFQMNLQELAILKEFQTPVKILLMNNGYLGMVRQWQEMFNDSNYAETTLDVAPHWDHLCKAYDVSYTEIDNIGDAKAKLEDLIFSDQAEFINLLINKEANVYPMVPAGCSLDEVVGDFENETHSINNS